MISWRGHAKELMHRVQKRIRFRNIARRTPTFVYQMRKVGSSTVAHTLEFLDESEPLVHVHHLNPNKVRRNVATLRRNPGYLHEHVVTSKVLVNKKLDWGHFPCKVITLTREPVGRAVSFAFQDWKRQLTDVPSVSELSADRMIALIREKLQAGSFHADPGEWFERELKSVFGVDVFAVPYDFEQGYVTLQRGPVDVLIIRMEDLNRSLERGIADLFGLEEEEIQMRRSNIGKEKRYADLLDEVKERFRLSKDVGGRIWSTDYVQHFYGPDLDRLRRKWEDA